MATKLRKLISISCKRSSLTEKYASKPMLSELGDPGGILEWCDRSVRIMITMVVEITKYLEMMETLNLV